jgi:LCP family protein required for cell wall assembly
VIDWRRLLRDRRVLALIIGIPALVAVLVGLVLIADPFAEPSPSPVALESPTPSPSPTPPPIQTATPEPTPEPTPTPTPRPAALDDGRLSVLFLGSDDSAGRRNRRPTGDYLTDAITVVSVTENGRRLALISLPRDTADVPMADGSIWSGKINSLSYYRGPGTVRHTMEVLLGIHIDHYVQLDMDGFRTVIRQLRGVRVRVPYTLHDVRCTIKKGVRHMDAERALCYARHRYSDSDYARARRHQQLLLAIRDRMLRHDVNYRGMIRTLDSLRTDVRLLDIPAFADLVRRTRRAHITRLILAPPTYTTFVGLAGARGWISVPDVPAIRQAVAAALRS